MSFLQYKWHIISLLIVFNAILIYNIKWDFHSPPNDIPLTTPIDLSPSSSSMHPG